MTDAIDLTTEQRKTLNDLLRRFLPGVVVWAYGSRVKWTAHPNSDLDLVAFTTSAQRAQVADLKDALAESNLPFPVDLHVWDDVPERFREIIRKDYVVVQEAKEPTPKQGLGDGWRERPLGELAEIFDGPHATPAKTQAGPIFLGISNLAQGRVSLSEVEHLSEDDYVRWTRRIEPRAGDVVFSYETRLGEAARVPQGLRCCLGRRMGLLRARKGEIDERFLLYAYLGPQFQEILRSRTVPGSTVDRIPLIDMPQFSMVVPTDLDEQRAIAHILGTLDDKIELNRRMNETLEAMARALFRSWFVDFDPVRAKAAGRDSGLPRHLADLFPNSFEGSELGEIPKEWDVKLLSEVCTLGRGASPRPINDYMNGEIPWVKIADATAAGGPFLFETKERLKTAGVDKSVMVSPGDLILSNSATCGVPMFVELHGCIHDGWLHFKNLRLISKLYLFHVLIELAEHLVHIADGSVQKNLNTELVGRQYVLVPPQAVVAAFDKQATTWFTKMRDNGIESSTLATLRDTLLPKLISGELRMRDGTHLMEITQ